jgi:hypothetical protein
MRTLVQVGPEVMALDGNAAIPGTALDLFQATLETGEVFDAEVGVILDIGDLAVALDTQDAILLGTFGVALFSGVGKLGNLSVLVHRFLPG